MINKKNKKKYIIIFSYLRDIRKATSEKDIRETTS